MRDIIVQTRYHLKEGKPQNDNWTFLCLCSYRICIRGIMSGTLFVYVGNFICIFGVVVSYFSHHWSVMMSWYHLFDSPWRHHIPMMVGDKYAVHWVLDQLILGPSV